jgi:hypothetical protein
MRISRFPGTLPLAAAVLSLASLSCGDRHELATRPTLAVDAPSANPGVLAPPPGRQPGFYPLATGNHWSYTQEVVLQLVDVPDPPPPERSESSLGIEILQPATFDGREYLGELTTNVGPLPPQQRYAPVRQDATGLYEWSPVVPIEGGASPQASLRIAVPAGRSPAEHAALELAARRLEEKIAAVEVTLGRRAAAGFKMSLPPTRTQSEVTRLQYPLESKSEWRIRQDRRFNSTARVIGQETLNLPPGPLTGYRVAMISDALGRNDSVTWWYGDAGLLQEVQHFELQATDASGNLVGRYLYEVRQWLTSYEIPPPHDVPPWPPRRPK